MQKHGQNDEAPFSERQDGVQRIYIGGIDPLRLSVEEVINRLQSVDGVEILSIEDTDSNNTNIDSSSSAGEECAEPGRGLKRPTFENKKDRTFFHVNVRRQQAKTTTTATTTTTEVMNTNTNVKNTNSCQSACEILASRYHNVLWRGCRLRVEPARPHFLERLAKEIEDRERKKKRIGRGEAPGIAVVVDDDGEEGTARKESIVPECDEKSGLGTDGRRNIPKYLRVRRKFGEEAYRVDTKPRRVVVPVVATVPPSGADDSNGGCFENSKKDNHDALIATMMKMRGSQKKHLHTKSGNIRAIHIVFNDADIGYHNEKNSREQEDRRETDSDGDDDVDADSDRAGKKSLESDRSSDTSQSNVSLDENDSCDEDEGNDLTIRAQQKERIGRYVWSDDDEDDEDENEDRRSSFSTDDKNAYEEYEDVEARNLDLGQDVATNMNILAQLFPHMIEGGRRSNQVDSEGHADVDGGDSAKAKKKNREAMKEYDDDEVRVPKLGSGKWQSSLSMTRYDPEDSVSADLYETKSSIRKQKGSLEKLGEDEDGVDRVVGDADDDDKCNVEHEDGTSVISAEESSYSSESDDGEERGYEEKNKGSSEEKKNSDDSENEGRTSDDKKDDENHRLDVVANDATSADSDGGADSFPNGTNTNTGLESGAGPVSMNRLLDFDQDVEMNLSVLSQMFPDITSIKSKSMDKEKRRHIKHMEDVQEMSETGASRPYSNSTTPTSTSANKNTDPVRKYKKKQEKESESEDDSHEIDDEEERNEDAQEEEKSGDGNDNVTGKKKNRDNENDGELGLKIEGVVSDTIKRDEGSSRGLSGGNGRNQTKSEKRKQATKSLQVLDMDSFQEKGGGEKESTRERRLIYEQDKLETIFQGKSLERGGGIGVTPSASASAFSFSFDVEQKNNQTDDKGGGEKMTPPKDRYDLLTDESLHGNSGGFCFSFSIDDHETSKNGEKSASPPVPLEVNTEKRKRSLNDIIKERELGGGGSSSNPSTTPLPKKEPNQKYRRHRGWLFPKSFLDELESSFFSMNEGLDNSKEEHGARRVDDNGAYTQDEWYQERRILTLDWKRKEKRALATLRQGKKKFKVC